MIRGSATPGRVRSLKCVRWSVWQGTVGMWLWRAMYAVARYLLTM